MLTLVRLVDFSSNVTLRNKDTSYMYLHLLTSLLTDHEWCHLEQSMVQDLKDLKDYRVHLHLYKLVEM